METELDDEIRSRLAAIKTTLGLIVMSMSSDQADTLMAAVRAATAHAKNTQSNSPALATELESLQGLFEALRVQVDLHTAQENTAMKEH